jgi:hypothetical protein
VPTPEHYLPFLYTLALQDKHDTFSYFNDQAMAGSLTMTSLLINTPKATTILPAEEKVSVPDSSATKP